MDKEREKKCKILEQHLNLKDQKSQIYMLNFWATWCAPCKEEMPHLDKLKSKSTFQDLEIIPINIADEELVKSVILVYQNNKFEILKNK